MTYRIRSSCRLCDAALRVVLDLGDVPLANAYETLPRDVIASRHYPLYISECVECGHVQLPVVVDPKLLFSEYSYTSSTAASFRQHVSQLADGIARPGGFLVDIGSNDGLLLSQVQERGMRALGIDPAQNLAAEATARGQLTLPAFLTPSLAHAVRRVIAQPATVTALNVFAHADNLDAICEAVRILIEPGGTFVFEVAYLLDVLEKNEIGTLYHEHTSHHHVGPLVALFRKHGMVLTRVERVASQGGSIRGYVRVGGMPDGTIPALIELEDAIPDMLLMWPERVRREKEALNAIVHQYRSEIAIYGAPARLTTWAYTMDLSRLNVTAVFDDEPRKIGKYSPGLRWPIVSSSELMKLNPPAILVSAWPYLSDIKRRFPNYPGVWLTPPRNV